MASDGGVIRNAPIEYIEMLVLPARGISYSEVRAMSLAERHQLFLMLEVESRVQRLKSH